MSTTTARPQLARELQPQVLAAFLIAGVFLLGTDNLVIGAIAEQIATSTHSTVEDVTWGISLYSAAYGFGALFLAPVADLISRRAVLLTGALVFSATGFGIAISHGIVSFLVLRFVSGLAAAAVGPNLWATANQRVEAERRATVTSWMMAAFNLATVIGVPLGLLAASVAGWSSVFWALGVLFLALAAAFYLMGETSRPARAFTFSAHFGNIGSALRANALFYLAMLCGSASYLMVYPFLAAWQSTQPHGVRGTALTVYFLLIGAASFLGSLAAPRLMRRMGGPLPVTRLLWSLRPLAVLAVLGAQAVFHQPLGFFLVLALWTFVTGTGNSSFMVYMGSRGGKIVSSVMALTNTSIFVGFTAGSFIGSITWGTGHSIAVNTVIALGLAVCAAGLLTIAARQPSGGRGVDGAIGKKAS